MNKEKGILPSKWAILAVGIGVVAVLGMMIASVVIGSTLTKNLYVGTGNTLIQESGSPVVTAAALYTHKLSVFTPRSVLEGIKSLDVNVSVNGFPSIYHMEVMSYLLVPKQKLTFYGNNRQVEIGLDGKMHLEILENNFKRSEPVRRQLPLLAHPTGTSTINNVANLASNYIIITSCADLLNIQITGNYLLANDLECTLNAPLCQGAIFAGTFDGGMNSLTLNMNCNDHAGLFDIFNGLLLNLNIFGTVQGFGYVGAFGAQLHGGSISNCGSYASITCNGPSVLSNYVSGAGGFFGNCLVANPINFQGCVSQGNVYCYGTQGTVGSTQGSTQIYIPSSSPSSAPSSAPASSSSTSFPDVINSATTNSNPFSQPPPQGNNHQGNNHQGNNHQGENHQGNNHQGNQGSAQWSGQIHSQGNAGVSQTISGQVSSQAVYASGYVGCLTSLNNQISNDLSGLTFQSCLSVPNNCQAYSGYSSPFANPIGNSNQICASGECNHNWNCDSCYYDQWFSNSFCGANPAPIQWLTCPPVNFGNGYDFHYTCNAQSTVYPVSADLSSSQPQCNCQAST